jgi:hypothetical protein
MIFEFSDAWLLQSIRYSEKRKTKDGADVSDIIAFADYSNHAIMSYQEFLSGAKKLICSGLVAEENKKLFTTDIFREWWRKKFEGKRKIGMQKELEEIERYLNKNFGSAEDQGTELNISKLEFRKATIDYLEAMNLTIKKAMK